MKYLLLVLAVLSFGYNPYSNKYTITEYSESFLLKQDASSVESKIETSNKLSAYPNPFNPIITISHSGAEIYNIQGKLVKKLSGKTWRPAEKVPAGVYIVRSHGVQRKILFVK